MSRQLPRAGALPQPDGLTRFALWAPDARRVDLQLGDGSRLPMQALDDGWYSLEIPSAAGSAYRFCIDERLSLADPASRAQAGGVEADSLVLDHTAYAWPRIIYEAALYWGADAIVGEVNYGGEMIEAAINTFVRSLIEKRQPYLPIPFVAVRARGGAGARLAVMAQAYELGLCHHVGRPERWQPLEAQLHAFDPSRDKDEQVARVEKTLPSGVIVTETVKLDRMDARVWAHLYLSGDEQAAPRMVTMLGKGGADLLASIR